MNSFPVLDMQEKDLWYPGNRTFILTVKITLKQLSAEIVLWLSI